MELVATIGATLLATATEAGTALASAGSIASSAFDILGTASGAIGPAAAAESGMSSLSLLRDGFSVFQGLSSLAAGSARASEARQQAGIQLANERSAQISGLRAQNDTTDDLVHTLAAQRVALSGAGVDLSVGIGSQILDNTQRRGDVAREQIGLDASIRARAARLSSRSLMASADSAMFDGLIQAASAGSNLFARSAARG